MPQVAWIVSTCRGVSGLDNINILRALSKYYEEISRFALVGGCKSEIAKNYMCVSFTIIIDVFLKDFDGCRKKRAAGLGREGP